MFKKGDIVVMHSCLESKYKNNGKLWVCDCDSFYRENGTDEKMFLKGFSGSFSCKYLQLVKLDSLEESPNE